MTLAVVVVTLALLGATVVVGALGWRSWLTERQRRRLEISRRLRSSAMALVDTDDAEPPILTGVSCGSVSRSRVETAPAGRSGRSSATGCGPSVSPVVA